MSSAARKAANRRNAQKSTGPRSAAGKDRTRYNALRHGLSIPAALDPTAADRVKELMLALDQVTTGYGEYDFAKVVAEAQVDIERVRQAKAAIVNKAAQRQSSTDLALTEQVALGFASQTNNLARLERYERRALSLRKRWLENMPKK
jgi:hypothetical protein